MQISPSIHILRHDFTVPVAPGKVLERFVYSVLIFGKGVTLIDCGVKGGHEKIFDYVGSRGRRIEEIDRLILSHSHPDHIGAASHIQSVTGCRILAHKAEKDWIEDIALQNQERPVPGFFDLVDSSVRIDEYLEHHHILHPADGLSLQCLHTPGHSRGLLSFWIPEEGVLFTGDCIPVEMDIPNYDHFKDLTASLTFLQELPTPNILLSSWALPISDQANIREAFERGERYLSMIDTAVKKHYLNRQASMDCCRNVIAELQLPPVFVVPVVHRAFLSHID